MDDPTTTPAGGNSNLQAILQSVLAQYRTQRALAADLLLSESRLGKILRKEQTSMTVERCLLLARIAGLPPSEVLRAARKSRAASLIEQLYGPERAVAPRPQLTREQTELIRRLGRLNNTTQKKLLEVLHHILSIVAVADQNERDRREDALEPKADV